MLYAEELYAIAIRSKKRLPIRDEKFIMKYADWSYAYAKNILHRRWKRAEKVICSSDFFAYMYAKDVVKGRWEMAETRLLTTLNIIVAFWYAEEVVKGRWEGAELIIATNPNKSLTFEKERLAHYAAHALKFKIKHKSFYIKNVEKIWDSLPEELKNDPDIMTAYFKDAILK
jgi:hypothetical protein